jgi:hypothetical protein
VIISRHAFNGAPLVSTLLLCQFFTLELLEDTPNLIRGASILSLVVRKLYAFKAVNPPELDNDIERFRGRGRIRRLFEVVGKVRTDAEGCCASTISVGRQKEIL